jgi:hypothetical protein
MTGTMHAYRPTHPMTSTTDHPQCRSCANFKRNDQVQQWRHGECLRATPPGEPSEFVYLDDTCPHHSGKVTL